MKKLVTWISKTLEVIRAKTGLGERLNSRDSRMQVPGQTGWSLLDRLSDVFVNSFQKLTLSLNGLLRRKSSLVQGAAIPAAPSSTGKSEKPALFNIPPPFSLFVKPLIIVVCLIAVYAIAGFYIVPSVLKSKVPAIIQEQTGRKASIEKIEFNPFKLFASVTGFRILEKNGKQFAGFDNLSVKVNFWQSIAELALVVDGVTLKKPMVRLVKDKQGKFNFEDMAKPGKEKPEEKKEDKGGLFPLQLASLSLADGKILWEDNHFAKPVSEEINPINLNLTDFSTEPKAKAKLDFDLSVKSGGKLEWKAKAGVNPVFSEGNIKLDKLQLQRLIALAMAETAPFDLQGQEFFSLDYKLEQHDKDFKVNINKTRLELKDIQFTDNSPAKNQLKTPSFAFETDASVIAGKDKLDVVVKKATLNGKDLKFSNQQDSPIFIDLPEFTHESGIKINQSKEGLKITSDKTRFGLKNLQFNGLKDQMVEAKIPEITLETAYQVAFKDKATEVNVSQGKFDLRDLQVSEQGEQKSLVKIASFGLAGIGVDLNKQEVVIDAVTSKDAEFESWLTKEGEINYQTLMPASPAGGKKRTDETGATAQSHPVLNPDDADAKPSPVESSGDDRAAVPHGTDTASSQPKKDWLIKISSLELQNYGLNFEDRSLKKPERITVKPVNIKVSDITSKLDGKLPFQLDIGVNKTGSIKLKGNAVAAPLLANVDVDISGIELDKFQPYVDKFAKVDVIDGNFNTKGKLVVKHDPGKPVDIKYKGQTNIADLVTRDQILSKDLIKWENLTLKNLDVDVLANKYSASALIIEKPYARVTIRKDKTVNFSDLVVQNKATPVKTSKPVKPVATKTVAEKKPTFKLAKIKIINGTSDFADLSLILPFAAQIKGLNGGADGISSDQKATIKVDLKGSAYDLAPVDVNGEISPYQGKYNVNLNFDGLPMPLVTPYMVQFAGYKIEKGKLTLALQYQIDNKKLNAGNQILIDQLELGEKVDNPDAVSLPLDLAITLLKDSEGKIKLDVPLTGSLEDPQFSVGGLIWDALVNVLTKIVTAPFSALASLAGSDEDLSTVAFKAGNDGLDAKEMEKLDSVAKALKEKTDLNIEIKGAAFEAEDWPALQDDALADQLKRRKAEELTKEEGKKVRAEYVELTEDDYNDLLADAFIEKFPGMAEKSIFGTPKLINTDAGDFYKVAKQKMQESIKPEPERLKHLANDRAKAIAKYLVQKTGIPNSRVFILDSAVDPKREGKEIVSALSLKTN